MLLPQSTPHARGSTPKSATANSTLRVYPACAGIHPPRASPRTMRERLPRMRGDPPVKEKAMRQEARSTPHARGSTLPKERRCSQGRVYPACAGIHLLPPPGIYSSCHLPRMRGDPPEISSTNKTHQRSTPHARGSTCKRMCMVIYRKVYPACAGIHPTISIFFISSSRLPRMRGDPPSSVMPPSPPLRSTPHARGSTLESKRLAPTWRVYPACAGIHHEEVK